MDRSTANLEPSRKMNHRITLKMIAEKAGVHYSTVSLALNNHPSIPQSTKHRIQTLAAEMGYKPDPILSSLVAYRTLKRKADDHGTLAWVDMWPAEGQSCRLFPALWSGATARANTLGWKLEVFNPTVSGLTPDRFSRMLYSRGIEGLLIVPMPGDSGAMSLEWDKFSSVVVGLTLSSPRLHRVMPHHFHNMQLLMQKLFALGYRRPGFVLDHTINERTSHYWTAAYLDAQPLSTGSQRMEPFVQPSDMTRRGAMLDWIDRCKPDVLISSCVNETIAILKSAGIRIPEEMGVVSVAFQTEGWEANKKPLSTGIDEQFDKIGSIAVDTLIRLMHHHERGIPENAMHIMIEGRWELGSSVGILDSGHPENRMVKEIRNTTK